MRLLLDTHVFIQYFFDSRRLRAAVRERIASATSEVCVSAGSAWEIAIKAGLGKLDVPGDIGPWMKTRMEQAGFVALPISIEHAAAVRGLPRLHGDPFDRILIAQAQVERMTIVTADRHFAAYKVDVLPA